MATQDRIAVPLAYANILSSSTSTSSIAAVDLGPYFNVGKRSVKFVISLTSLSTVTTTATVGIYQGSSASTANSTSTLMTLITLADGSSATYTSTADTSAMFEINAMVSSRYVQARYIGSTSTGSTWGVSVVALPQVRATG